MSDQMTAFSISAVIFQEGEWWIAQCLEHDISAQAESPSELHYELERVLFAHLCASAQEGRQPFEGLGPAPKKYWRMWEKSKLTVEAEELPFSADIPIPPFVAKLKLADEVNSDRC